MNESFNKCLECRIKSTAVSVLNTDELHLLNSNCTTRAVSRGDIILKEGDPARFVVYIREGFVKQYKRHAGGEEQIISITKKGSYLGLHNIVESTRFNYVSAKAIKGTSVCFINKECFNELLKLNGEFASRVISCICEDEVSFVNRLLNNQQQQLYGRLAEALLYFRHVVYSENPFVLDMTKAELASFIGSSRESVSRALKDFQDHGHIRIDKKLIDIREEVKLLLLCKKG